MFLSTSLRLLVNVESLNSVESVGNVSRHRTVPIVVPGPDGYSIKYVPAVSGESIAHGYQSELVDIAQRAGLPVGVYSSRKEFIKFSENDYLKDEGIFPPKDYDDIRRFEVDVLLKDVVADVGGFMYIPVKRTGDIPVKRTSRFQVGYMLPALEDVTKAAALEAQFHVRFLFSKQQKGGEGAALGQIPYNIEAASALYTLTFNLDIAGIAVPSTTFGKKSEASEKQLAAQAPKRRLSALKALGSLLSNLSFGAKHSRYLPNSELMSCILTVSSIPFTVSPGNTRAYIAQTSRRMKQLSSIVGGEVKAWAVAKEELEKPSDVIYLETVEEIIGSVIDVLRGKGMAE